MDEKQAPSTADQVDKSKPCAPDGKVVIVPPGELFMVAAAGAMLGFVLGAVFASNLKR